MLLITQEQILAYLPLGPLELGHLATADRVQLASYLNDMFTSIIIRLEFLNLHMSCHSFATNKYKAPSGKITTDEEALWIFEGLKNAGFLEAGRGSELATEIVRSLKAFELID